MKSMELLMYISDFIVPAVILLVVAYGVSEKVKVYDEFIRGAKKGFYTVIKIMPTLIGLMVAVGILRASGFLEFLAGLIGKVTDYIGFTNWVNCLHYVKLYRNHILYHECLFYGSKSEKDKIHTYGSTFGHIGRNDCKCVAGGVCVELLSRECDSNSYMEY